MKDAVVVVVKDAVVVVEKDAVVVVEKDAVVVVVKDAMVVVEKDAVVVKDAAAVVVVEKDVAVVVEEEEEGTRSSKYPNPYSHHPCVYHRLCVREKCNSQLKEGTKPPANIRLHRLGELYSPV